MTPRAIALALVLLLPAAGFAVSASSTAPLAATSGPNSVEECARAAPLPPCNLWASRLPTGPANEVHVAVNPLDPRHLLAVAKDYSLGSNQDCRPGGAFHVGSASYVSFDGGLTWSVTRVPAPYPNGGAEPSPLKYRCGSDPVAAFGPDGTAYYILLNFQYTGGRQAAIAVARSTDGGRTWPADGIRVLHTSGGDDKEWGTVSRDGRVHVVWTDLSTGGIMYARSVSSYDEWDVKRLASAGGGNPAVTVDAGPDSEVYVLWRDSSSIRFTKSVDGGATFSPIRLAFTTSPYTGSGQPRLPFMPQLAVDDTPASPYAGTVYVTWPDTRGGFNDPDAYLAYSRDGGATWSQPVRVSDDVTRARQVMPTVSVAPNGRVDVTWLDQRLALSREYWSSYVASSTDGGATFGPNRLVSEMQLDQRWSRHQDGSIFIGDYVGIASTNDYAYPIFPGNGIDRLDQGLPLSKFQRSDAYVAPVGTAHLLVQPPADAAWRGPVASVEVGDVPEGSNDPLAVLFTD